MYVPPTLQSLWSEDITSVDDFDPFDADLPGISVSERLRYLFLKVVIQNGANEWRSPDSPQFRILALRSLYAAMIGFNRDNIPLLYPNGQPTSDDLWLTSAQQANGPSIRDRCCGHVFEKGETYYRCKQCCADSTVVICSRCFNTQDHSSHSVTMLVGNGSGGCCDCGDPEAFHAGAPRCGIHVASTPDADPPPIPDEVRESIKETMETALDFFIDVFSTTPLEKIEINEDDCNQAMKSAQVNYELDSPHDEKEHGDWILTLYNDEIHSYTDVTFQLERLDAQRYDKEGALCVARKIDTIGRDPIAKSPDQAKIIENAELIMRIGLFCSVRSERDYLRECLGGIILEWLVDCISIGVSVGGDEMILRETMCQVLAGAWNMGISYPDPRVELEPQFVRFGDELPSDSFKTDWTALSPDSENFEELWNESEYIRLDWLLFFDARLWKSMRKCVKSIILGCLLGGKVEVAGTAIDPWGPRNWKRITGIRFARDFAQLCRLWLKYDREGHLSVTKLGVQIFTTPSISLELVERYNFLTHLLAIEYTYFTNDGQIGRPSDVDPTLSFDSARDDVDPDTWKPDTQVMDIQGEVHHLLGNEAVRRMIPKQRNWFMQFLEFFQLFQGMHAQKRETDQHREYESNAWEIASNITGPMTRLMGYLSDGFATATREELQWAFQHALSLTYRRCSGAQMDQFPYSDPVRPVRWHKPFANIEVVDFKVASQYVSLYYPLNWMVSLLVSQIVDVDRDAPTDWDSWIPINRIQRLGHEFFGITREKLILTCADYPLRANVFCSQIRAKLWARNGAVMYRQCFFYDYTVAHSKSCGDFTFLQWAFAVLPPETMLMAMIDRYDLIEHLLNSYWDGSHPIYRPEHLKVMMEEFFQMFLNLMNERDSPLGSSPEDIVRREIAHRLIFKKLPYSEVLRHVVQNTAVQAEDYFDANLKEMANFTPPTQNSPGFYHLKPEHQPLVDAHHRSYTRNQAVECERVLVSIMASNGVPEPNRIVEPQERVLKPIVGPFAGLTKVLGTGVFTRVIFCALRYARSNPSEIILDQAIFLCLIAVMHPETQHQFVKRAQELNTREQSSSLVYELVTALGQPRFTSLYPKLRNLLAKMKALDPEWFDSKPQINTALSGVEDTIAAEIAEHKKKVAKNRQMEALKKMKLAQAKFQESNKALLDESDSDDFVKVERMEIDESPLVETFQFPKGTCILCQEKVDDEKPYCIPAKIHQSVIARCTPLDNEHFVQEVITMPASLDLPFPRPFGQANWQGTRQVVDSENNVKTISEKVIGVGFPSQPHNENLTVTTCGHILHYACYNSYFASLRHRTWNPARNPPEHTEAGEFLCPLCRAISNTIIPILWKEGTNRHVSGPVYTDITLEASEKWLQEFKTNRPIFRPDRAYENVLARLAKKVGADGNGLELDFERPFFRQPEKEYDAMYQHVFFGKQFGEHFDMAPLDSRVDEYWDQLLVFLAGTITQMEIVHRGTGEGIGTEISPPVLGALSPQDLTLLRLLASSVSNVTQHRLRKIGSHTPWKEFYAKHLIRLNQMCPFLDFDIDETDLILRPLLNTDIFERFVLNCGMVTLTTDLNVGQLLLIHYIAEIVKIVFAIQESDIMVQKLLGEDSSWIKSDYIPAGQWSPRKVFVKHRLTEISETYLNGLYHMLQRFILPFLRKAVIFVHVFENVVFPQIDVSDEPESDRLCRLLGLPTITDVFDMENMPVENDSEGSSKSHLLVDLIENWIRSAKKHSEESDDSHEAKLEIQHPAVFELIGLPHRFDNLFELASKYHCPKCHIVPDEPTMCLLCGEIVCAQALCCSEQGTGEMNLHREQCSKSIGVFLWMKKNAIIFLRRPSGDHAKVQGELKDAPYLNVHGETERDLRTGQPQFLSQERFDKIVRTPLLKHAVETEVARRIESIYDAGGWETL